MPAIKAGLFPFQAVGSRPRVIFGSNPGKICMAGTCQRLEGKSRVKEEMVRRRRGEIPGQQSTKNTHDCWNSRNFPHHFLSSLSRRRQSPSVAHGRNSTRNPFTAFGGFPRTRVPGGHCLQAGLWFLHQLMTRKDWRALIFLLSFGGLIFFPFTNDKIPHKESERKYSSPMGSMKDP